jgi:hypothetical protein
MIEASNPHVVDPERTAAMKAAAAPLLDEALKLFPLQPDEGVAAVHAALQAVIATASSRWHIPDGPLSDAFAQVLGTFSAQTASPTAALFQTYQTAGRVMVALMRADVGPVTPGELS